MISAIVAVDKNNGIGKNGDLLFTIPEDMDRFVELTNGKRIIMGRKTFNSLPKALPNRFNMIITGNDKKVSESSMRILNVMTGLSNLKNQEDADTLFSKLADENNAIEVWYGMNGIKNYLENEIQNPTNEEIFVIGGGQIYRELLPYCDKVYLTRYDKEYDADTYFPKLIDEHWKVVEESEPQEYDGANYQFITYERVQ